MPRCRLDGCARLRADCSRAAQCPAGPSAPEQPWGDNVSILRLGPQLWASGLLRSLTCCSGRVLPSRTMALRVRAGAARTCRSAMGPGHWRGMLRRRRASVAGASRSAPRSRATLPRMRASWSRSVWVMAGSLSRPLIERRAEERGSEPPSAHRVETRSPRRWGNAGSTPPAPQSKPVTLTSRLVTRNAPLVAFGLGLRILAAGPAPQPTLLLSRAHVCGNLKFVAIAMKSPRLDRREARSARLVSYPPRKRVRLS